MTIKEKKVGVKRAENRTVSVAAGDVQKAGKQMPAKSHADVKEKFAEKIECESAGVTKTGKMQRSAKIQGNGKLQSNAKTAEKMPEQDCRLAWMPQRFQNVWRRHPHNRTKNTSFRRRPSPISGRSVPNDGRRRAVKSRYDKFRQINRFLEFIEDVLPNLDPNRMNTIIDSLCGKSYLTFAMYYYLHVLKNI